MQLLKGIQPRDITNTLEVQVPKWTRNSAVYAEQTNLEAICLVYTL